MRECYSWKENRLMLSDTYENIFDFHLRGNKTIVQGNSGTGKTLLYNAIKVFKDINDSKFADYDLSNIVLIDKNNVNEIGTFKKKLIVIDRADVIITPDVGQIINSDFGINRYLIFARTFIGVEISPNYYATVVRTGKELTLKYMFSVKGWF